MSSWNPNAEIDDEEDDEDFVPNYGGREGTIYLVDADPCITEDPETFNECLKCIEASLLNGIFSNDKDLVAVVFYNTLHSPPPKDVEGDPDLAVMVPPHTAVFMPMKPLTKDSVQYFKNFMASEDYFDFENKYGNAPSNSFSEALWLCSRLFMRCGYKLGSSSIILFTNNEQPHFNGTMELQMAFRRAKDLCDTEVAFVVVPMIDEFDMDIFFKEFLCMVRGIEPDQFRCMEPVEQRQMLLNRIYQRDYRKTCQRHMRLTLAEGLQLGCGIYSFTKKGKLPKTVKMIRDSDEVIVSKRCYMGEQLNEELEVLEFTKRLLPGDLKKCQTLAGQDIFFTLDELTSVRALIPPGMRLLGFKPLESLDTRRLIKSSKFLYPNESHITGSTKLFRALWEKCLEKEVYALVAFTFRRKVAPRYIALVPQTEETDGNDGFRIVFLPTISDENALEVLERPPPPPTREGADLFKKIMRKIKFKYTPDLFINPHSQSFYMNIEALVFDETGVEAKDTTLPNDEYLDGKMDKFVQELTDTFGQETYGVKRAAGDAEGGRKKSARKELTHEEIEEAIRNGQSAFVTVPDLKGYLQSKGQVLPKSAIKKNLVEAVERLIA